MLDKKDLEEINTLIIKNLGDFFEKILAPYLDEQFSKNDREHTEIIEKLEDIDKRVYNHEDRIKRLEVVTSS